MVHFSIPPPPPRPPKNSIGHHLGSNITHVVGGLLRFLDSRLRVVGLRVRHPDIKSDPKKGTLI